MKDLLKAACVVTGLVAVGCAAYYVYETNSEVRDNADMVRRALSSWIDDVADRIV